MTKGIKLAKILAMIEGVKYIKNNEPLPPLIIGASGFVASEIIRLRGAHLQYTPDSQTLDITNLTRVDDYFSRNPSEVVINFAAYTNVKEAETQRNSHSGDAWKLNVEGVKNLAIGAHKNNKFLIHISTDSVFPGGLKFHLPYKESDPPAKNSRQISWYGYTKLMGEKALQSVSDNFAIIRIAYPFSGLRNSKDYIYKLIQIIKNGHPLFCDQIFTPTYLSDLHSALNVLISTKHKGIFHIATSPPTTPYQFGLTIAKLTNLNSPQKSSLRDYIKNEVGISQYALHGGLSTIETQKKLGLEFYKWEEALYEALKKGFI